MDEKDVVELLEKIENLTPEEKKKRDLYLKRLGPRPNVDEYTKEELKTFKEFLLRMKNKLTESIDMVIE